MLLGARLRCESADGAVAVVITEVEAYDGEHDPASHAFRGRTARNAVMFGPAGHLYVYRSYGMHWCANIVTGDSGAASAVLLRSGRVVEGRALAQARRGPRVTERGLARGPGCFCQALGITDEHNGASLDAGAITLTLDHPVPVSRVLVGPRVGISRAHDLPWRFWLADEPSVSAYKLSPRAPA